MDKEILIKNSVRKLKRLPLSAVSQVSDYVNFLSNKYDESRPTHAKHQLIISESDSFAFLDEEEDLYSVKDLNEA